MLEFHADPAREMRIAKRIAYAVVLVFVVTVLPLYVLVFRLSPLELSVALGPGLLSSLGVVLPLPVNTCRLYEGERESARRLQELNRMKSDFLITVSHELRTPLTSVRTAAEMLLEEEEKEDSRGVRTRLARSIAKGANRLASLVAALVAASREDELAPRLELEPLPAQEMVSGAVALMNPLLAVHRQTLSP